MAVPNINQLTAALREMPDNQLQQYAAMHKSDPYVLSLAVAESNARKQMRAGQQAAMAGQKQPTVVEQDLMGMTPVTSGSGEAVMSGYGTPVMSQGLTSLKAPNVEHMADGGIAGFDDNAEQLQYNNEPVLRMAKGGIAHFADTGYVQSTPYSEQMRNLGDFLLSVPRRIVSDPSLAAEEREKEERDYKKAKGASKLNVERDAAMAKVLSEGRTQPAMENDPRLPANYKPQTIKEQEGKKPQTALEKAAEDNAAAASARPAATPSGGGFPSTLGQFTPSTPEELSKQAEAVAKVRQAESDTAYKPYTEMLQKERADLEGRKEGNLKDAMLRAGLAMMAGKSQHALQNIGEGGIQGVNAYQEAKRADDAAKKALMGSEIALMQAQRAERSGNHKDAIALMGQAQQQKEFGVTAAMKAQELKQTGEYQRGMVGAAQSKLDLMRDAYGIKDKQIIAKYASQAENNLAKQDPLWNTYSDVLKQQKVQSAMRTLLSADPNYAHLASGIGFSATPNSQLVRTLNKDEE